MVWRHLLPFTRPVLRMENESDGPMPGMRRGRSGDVCYSAFVERFGLTSDLCAPAHPFQPQNELRHFGDPTFFGGKLKEKSWSANFERTNFIYRWRSCHALSRWVSRHDVTERKTWHLGPWWCWMISSKNESLRQLFLCWAHLFRSIGAKFSYLGAGNTYILY